MAVTEELDQLFFQPSFETSEFRVLDNYFLLFHVLDVKYRSTFVRKHILDRQFIKIKNHIYLSSHLSSPDFVEIDFEKNRATVGYDISERTVLDCENMQIIVAIKS